ncbi:MAG: hypothetical protein LC772_08905, partial [Chloroflexi bacterium]|nr:hypothetical protein [Chloroflexota bacterium]
TAGGPEVPPLDQAKQQAQQVVQQAQQAAGQVAAQVRDQLQSRLTAEKDRAVEGLEIVGESLRSTGDKLQRHGQPMLSEYAVTAAESVEGLSGYLKNRDLGQIGREVEDFARSRPVLFLGSIFAVGVLSARFFKSTAQPQLPEGSSQGSMSTGSGAYGGTRTPAANLEVSTYVRDHNAAQVDAGSEA